MPLGLAEIATLLGVKRNTVDQWRTAGLLPAPDGTVGGRPAWWPATIDEWASRTNRTKERDVPAPHRGAGPWMSTPAPTAERPPATPGACLARAVVADHAETVLPTG